MSNVESSFYRPFLHELSSLPEAAIGGADPPEVYLAFLRHYQALRRLPRRERRLLERRWRRRLPAIALMLAVAPGPLAAATIDVTAQTPPAIAADGRCSLIEAIENANADFEVHDDCVAGSRADLIRLPSGSQQLLETDVSLPAITSAIRLDGRGSLIRRREDIDSPLIEVAPAGNLTLVRTVVSGDPLEPVAPGTAYKSPVVHNDHGVLSLVNSSVIDSPGGSGIDNVGGRLSLKGSTVSGNYYGGIVNLDSGSAVLAESEVVENHGYIGGGGIVNGQGSRMTLVNSTVARNTKLDSYGGGIGNGGSLVLVGTTVEGNNATYGGGIFNLASGTVTVTRSTISGNRAAGGPGGGVMNFGGSMSIINSTLSGNSSDYRGGAVVNYGKLLLSSSTVTGNVDGGLALNSGTTRLVRTVLTGNRELFGTGEYEIVVEAGATVKGNNFNVIGSDGEAGTVGFTPGRRDIVPDVPVSAILLPLAHNGGPTRTHALAIGSPALDAAPDDQHCLAVDQRGNPRPQRIRCDIGAFEGSAVHCAGEVTTIVGTRNNDVLQGTPGRDVIGGLNGHDRITGLGGGDVICGDAGRDQISGGAGNDLLLGGTGNDRLFGEEGSDTLSGGSGFDRCDGGPEDVGGDIAESCESITDVP